MTNIVKTSDVLGWTVGDAGDGEPRMRDLDLAERLGFAKPRTVRDLIRRHERAGNIKPLHVVRTVGRSGAAPRTEDEAWLDEADALFLTTKSETAAANLITREMIQVFVAARRAAASAPSLDELVRRLQSLVGLAEANPRIIRGGSLRENPVLADPIRRKFAFFAEAKRISLQKAHGLFRRQFKVFDLPVLVAWFDEQFGGRMPALPPHDSRQLRLFGGP